MQFVIKDEMSRKTTWRSMVATPGNRRRMILLVMLGCFSQWSGNGLVSYYLARVLETVGITAARDQNILNGCLMIFNWVTAVISAFLTAHLKRRTQFLISYVSPPSPPPLANLKKVNKTTNVLPKSVVGMFVVFAIQTLCAGLFNERHNAQAGKVVIPMLFFFYMFFNLAFNALLYSYPVEFLPYPIRAKGMSVLMFWGKGATFINAFVNPIGLKALGWKYYIVYVVWLSFEVCCVYFLVVETKGPSLEAIAEMFDGKSEAILSEESEETATVHDKKS